jgi:hypothetical protein
LVGFVHPASGRTVWHLATTVNIELFPVELEAFAQAGRCEPNQADRARARARQRWHDSPKVRVPEQVFDLYHEAVTNQWVLDVAHN